MLSECPLLKALPDSIVDCPLLESIYVDQGGLECFPNGFDKMVQLKNLCVTGRH
jgi:hypothetical protein